MKSFIETQRALLAEIQNGCKRNFVLAKEREETEQKMRQSASMAEISEETPRQEEESEEASAAVTSTGEEESGEGKEGENEAVTDGGESGKETGSQETSSAVDDSDSDTEEEEEDEKVVPASGGASSANDGTPKPASPAHQSPSSVSSCSRSLSGGAAQTASPSRTPTSPLSGITVTEAPVPPGTPPSPGRCISVSSPGRGHKIFMVTRVESPPEQPSLLAQLQAWKEQDRASQTQSQTVNQTKPSPGPSPNPKDAAAASPGPSGAAERQPDLQAQKEGNPAEQVFDPLGVQSVQPNPPALQPQKPLAETDSSATLEKQPNMASVVGVKEDLKESSLELSTEPKQPTSEGQTAAVATATPTPNTPEQQSEAGPNTHTQPQPSAGSTGALTSPEQVQETQSGSQTPAQAGEPIAAEQKASRTIPEPAAQEQQSGETPQESEQRQQPQQQTVEEQCALPGAPSEDAGKPELIVALETPEEKPDSCPGSEQHSSGQTLEEELEAELEVAEKELRLVSDQQHHPSQPVDCLVDSPALLPSLEDAATTTTTPAQEQITVTEVEERATVTTLNADTPQAEESSSGDSPDESSTDDGESATAEPSGAALPNGLKPEFALHLLDPEGPKPGSCVMEHGGYSSPPQHHRATE